MSLPRIIGIALVLIGVWLLVLGLRATDSFSSQVSNFFTGSPTDRAIWLTLGGAAAIIVGAGAALIPRRGTLS